MPECIGSKPTMILSSNKDFLPTSYIIFHNSSLFSFVSPHSCKCGKKKKPQVSSSHLWGCCQRRKEGAIQAGPHQGTDVPCRDVVCVHFSPADSSVFNTLQRQSNYPEYFYIMLDESGHIMLSKLLGTCNMWLGYSQEPVACTASPEVFFSLWGRVSDPLSYGETRGAPPGSHDDSIQKAGCANHRSGESVQKWAHQIWCRNWGSELHSVDSRVDEDLGSLLKKKLNQGPRVIWRWAFPSSLSTWSSISSWSIWVWRHIQISFQK